MEAYVRQARIEDLDKITEIFADGQEFLKKQGLPQWQDGHGPTRPMAEADIQKGHGFVLIFQGQVAGYAALVPSPDGSPPLSEGEWAGGYDRHLVIHRVAITRNLRGQGLSRQFLRDTILAARILGFQDLRIDTHPGNAIMQKISGQVGFIYRGTMDLPIPHGERLAYQIILD